MSRNLSWGVTICTYNREKFLMECIKHILNQTYLPAEIVVVDASDYWEKTLNQILNTYEEYWNKIKLVYKPADIRSLPFQRNQALELSQSDVIFSLDDDIYLYPDAAEIIMKGYQADESEQVAMIGAHFASKSPDEAREDLIHRSSDPVVNQNEVNHRSSNNFLFGVKEYLENKLSLDNHFVPYDQPLSVGNSPKSMQDLNIFEGGLINGGRTTFRRTFGEKVKWSTFLRYYATHEDSDFSYRMSKTGKLLVAPNARFFHADGNERILKRFKVNVIRVSNLMALHRVYSKSRLRSSMRLVSSFFYFVLLYLLIDLVQKRFTFPVVRAYSYGILLIPLFLFYPFRDFRAWYVARQQKMYRVS